MPFGSRSQHRLVVDVQQFAAGDEGPVERDARAAVPGVDALLDVQQHGRVHLGDDLGGAVVVLHQKFAGALGRGRLEAGLQGDRILDVEDEAVLAASGHEVQSRADLLHAPLGQPDDVRLRRGQQAAARQFGPVRAVPDGAGDPQHDVQVAQSPRALLHVGLEAVRCLVVLGVALLLLQHLGLEIRLAVHRADHGAREALELPAGPGDQPRFEHRRQHGDVARRLFAALVERAHAVPEGEPEVPQQPDEVLDGRPVRRVGRLLQQDQDVDVRMGEELSAAVAADRDQRRPRGDAARLGDFPQQVVDRPRQAMQQAVDGAAGVELRDQRVAFLPQPIAQLERAVVHAVAASDAGRPMNAGGGGVPADTVRTS